MESQEPTPQETVSPSKVIHVHSERDLKPKDIITCLSRFGEVAYVFNMKASNQMLVEMKDIESAKKVVEHYTKTNPPLMDGARLYFQYSVSKEINRDTSLDEGLLVVFQFYSVYFSIKIFIFRC